MPTSARATADALVRNDDHRPPSARNPPSLSSTLQSIVTAGRSQPLSRDRDAGISEVSEQWAAYPRDNKAPAFTYSRRASSCVIATPLLLLTMAQERPSELVEKESKNKRPT